MIGSCCATLILLGSVMFAFGCFKNNSHLAAIGASVFITASIIGIINKNEIKPIEVYQGKTTLKITYKDGVPIDSVVVFKDK